MSTEENKMLVRRQFDEIWNGANWATADELYAPNYVNHDPYNPTKEPAQRDSSRVSVGIAASSTAST